MSIKVYPYGFPLFREPMDRLLSSKEVEAAREEFAYRKRETRYIYNYAAERGNTSLRLEMSHALRLVEREEKRFFDAQKDLKRRLREAA